MLRPYDTFLHKARIVCRQGSRCAWVSRGKRRLMR